MTDSEQTKNPIKTTICYFCVATIVVTTIVGVAILIGAGWSADISAFGALALILVFFASIASALATTEVIPWNALSWSLLKDTKVLGIIGAIMLSSLGAVGGFLDLLQDKGGVQAAFAELNTMLGRIDENAEGARVAAEDAREDARAVRKGLEGAGLIGGEITAVEQAIDGVWGQSDCSNTYRFTLTPAGAPERVLSVISVASADGLAPFEGEYAFKSAHDQFGNDGFVRSILSTEELKGFDPGFAVDFTLVRSGSSEKLIWQSKSSELNAPELSRCPN